jgi:hypothetical protein
MQAPSFLGASNSGLAFSGLAIALDANGLSRYGGICIVELFEHMAIATI